MGICDRKLTSTSRLFLCAIASMTLGLSACSHHYVERGGTDSLQSLKELAPPPKRPFHKKKQMSKIRRMAIEESAMSIGAQSGLAHRAKEINAQLNVQQKKLDHIFDFHAMLMANNVLPPVLLQGNNSLNLDNDAAIRLADRSYRIVRQARFVTTLPNWRNYLWMHYDVPPRPHNTMLPKNKEEDVIWDEYVAKGWDQGIKQANNIYNENLARLTQDYRGMIIYHELLAQHMVSAPFVAHSSLGVTGNSEAMRINDQVLRITALPGLDTNSKNWKPAVTKERKLEQPLFDWKALATHEHMATTPHALPLYHGK